jgi:hypothetical protein
VLAHGGPMADRARIAERDGTVDLRRGTGLCTSTRCRSAVIECPPNRWVPVPTDGVIVCPELPLMRRASTTVDSRS